MDDPARDIVEKISATLREWRENHASVFGEFPAERFCQPAADFEKAQDLSDIAGCYTLPAGLIPADLQAYALRTWRQEHISPAAQQEGLSRLWHVLAAYNSELKQIPHDPRDTDALYHMIMGVASAYNIGDIQHFIANSTSSYKGLEMEASPEFIKLTEVFNRCAAPERLKLEWVAAPATLQLIQDKILKKYGQGF